MSIQVFQEFYVQSTRPNKKYSLSHNHAVRLINAWQRFEICPMSIDVFEAALELKSRFGYSYWDSAIIAAAQGLGCRTLYTEDMNHGHRIGQLELVNPFL